MTENKRSYRPPQAVRSNAKRGLELREKWKRGGLDNTQASSEGVGSGVQRASDLSNGESISYDTIVRMRSFFSRHANNYKPDKKEDDGGPTAGTIAWLLWGGSAGKQWADKIVGQEKPVEKSYAISNQILKVDDELGLVMGYAIVSKKNGEDYFDLHGDHIPEESMLKASVEFMAGERIVGDMHRTVEGGTVLFAWPMTTEIAKAFNIQTDTTGLMIAIKPQSQETLEKFRSGEYNGFSIGGTRGEDEEVNDE